MSRLPFYPEKYKSSNYLNVIVYHIVILIYFSFLCCIKMMFAIKKNNLFMLTLSKYLNFFIRSRFLWILLYVISTNIKIKIQLITAKIYPNIVQQLNKVIINKGWLHKNLSKWTGKKTISANQIFYTLRCSSFWLVGFVLLDL